MLRMREQFNNISPNMSASRFRELALELYEEFLSFTGNNDLLYFRKNRLKILFIKK